MASSDRMRTLHSAGPVPDGLPSLRKGSHRRPEQGACVMEYVSALAGEKWSDRPRCTHSAVTVLAQLVNDRVSTTARARLALLAPALIGTAGDDAVVVDIVVRDCADAGLGVRPGHRGLRRHSRRAQARIDRRTGPRRRRLAHVGRRPSVIPAFRGLLTVLLAEPRSRHDDVLVDLLETAVRHVREQLDRSSERPAPASVLPRRWVGATV